MFEVVNPSFAFFSLFFEVASAYLTPTMQKQWFQEQLRRAGKNAGHLAQAIGRDRAVVSRILNGRQRMTLEQAQAIADELGAGLADVLEQAGIAPRAVARVASGGFSESDAAPWHFRHQGDPGNAIAAALGADRPGIDVWQVRSGALHLGGLLPGDFLLLDTHAAERCAPGDRVIAQIYQRDSAVTVLRRYEPPVLVAASAAPEDQRVHVVDGINTVIMGRVIASWRMEAADN